MRRLLKRYTKGRTNASGVTRFSSGDLSTDGCIYLIGQIVRQAIADASNNYKPNRAFKRDGQRFLFRSNALEEFFAKYGLDRFVNCAMIRSMALDVIEGRKTLDDKIDLNRPTETDEATDETP
jgi:hypothetical protein